MRVRKLHKKQQIVYQKPPPQVKVSIPIVEFMFAAPDSW